jgi:hypothetical protein
MIDMKCKCGNEQGKPRVNPYPVSFKDDRSGKVVVLPYMGGFVTNWNLCWFCAFPSTLK